MVEPEAGVFAVADGLGGHPAGDVASALAVRTMAAALAAPALTDADDPEQLLISAIEGAHEAIRTESSGDLSRTGMATTVVLAAVHDGQAWIAHVGDSRGYVLTDDKLRQVTRDHGLGGYVTQAVGLDSRIEPSTTRLDLAAGSRLLLCTDGLSNMLDDQQIGDLLADGDAQQACDALVTAALDAGGVDNVTVVVLAP
jgi:PPM family protein phosphatase